MWPFVILWSLPLYILHGGHDMVPHLNFVISDEPRLPRLDTLLDVRRTILPWKPMVAYKWLEF